MKNIALRLSRSGYGHYREWHQRLDQAYDHTRDKHPVREKHNATEGWDHGMGATVRYRRYSDYEEYLVHQAQKLNELLRIKGGFASDYLLSQRQRFRERFREVPRLLRYDCTILCTGARQGTEVEVLRDMGYSRAQGIDINPGPNNPYVVTGDFMKMSYANNTFDLVYSNCLDHAFNLDTFFKEHARVMKKNGYAMFDVALQAHGGAFEAAEWDSSEAVFSVLLTHFKSLLEVKRGDAWLHVFLQGCRD